MSEQKEQKEQKEKQKTEEPAFQCRVERTTSNLTIWMKSPDLEKIFKTISGSRKLNGMDLIGTADSKNVEFWYPAALPTFGNYWATARVGDRVYHPSNGFNPRFLGLIGIGAPDGASFSVELPLSRAHTRAMVTSMRDTAGLLLSEFLEPCSFSAEVI